MIKFLLIIIIIIGVFACITMTSCQELGHDQWSAGNSDHKDPGSNRLGSITSSMDATSQFQIRKSLYNINETNKLFVVEIENLHNYLRDIYIQERVDNTIFISNHSNCYLVENASMKQKVINYLKNSGENSINSTGCLKPFSPPIPFNSYPHSDSYIEAHIPEICNETIIIYSFEIHPKEYVDKIPFLATTIVDLKEHPSTSFDYCGEINPNKVYDVTATPLTYKVSTGDPLDIVYQVEYRARTTDPDDLPILITFGRENTNYEIIKITCDRQNVIPKSKGLYIINTSINSSEPINVTLKCVFSIDGVFPIPMIYIKDDYIRHQIAFSEIKITVENEHSSSFWFSLFALLLTLLALAVSVYISKSELSENRKCMESNTKAMIDQGNKLRAINNTLKEANDELKLTNYNLDRIQEKMP